MKIALVSPYDFPYPGGVTEHVKALAGGLQRRGHDVQIFAASSSRPGSNQANVRVITRRIAKVPIGGTIARVGFWLLHYRHVKTILRQEKFDIIHLQEPLIPSLTWWFLLLAAPHIATVGTFHAYHEQPHWLYRRGRSIFSQLFAKLDRLIAVSQPARDFAGRLFPGNYHIIPNGVDLNRFGRPCGPHPQSATGEVTILFVGRPEPRKGFITLFEAFCTLQPCYPQLKLRVVGPFDDRQCRMYHYLAQTRGVAGLEFTGYVAPEYLPHFYHQADIFCAPSTGCESFGIVLLEAMAAELPVVASDITGYRALVHHGQEGLLLPPGQADIWAAALRSLIEQPEQRQRMGQLGRMTATQYNWDYVVDQTLAVYNDTV
ncbi:MAG: glycosyltransferase family 4 protein [Anaerolineae bacterium]|nr:glycosyltransferase family 4 protein [Anaerolineae bacterium]